jgi:hypothetical protein
VGRVNVRQMACGLNNFAEPVIAALVCECRSGCLFAHAGHILVKLGFASAGPDISRTA